MAEGKGRPVGILLYETAGERIAGDPGHPGTFDFPVRFGLVEGSYRDLIEGSEAAKQRLLAAARGLEEQNVCAIAGDCGLMVLYQRALANAVRVPVISSSLALLPMIRTVTARQSAIGVITGHSALLGERHLGAAGATADTNLTVQGMEEEPHFHEVVIAGRIPQDYGLMRRDLLQAAEKLVDRGEPIGALLLECSNLATFAAELYEAYKIPVYDINQAIRMLRHTAAMPGYRE